MSKEVNVEKLLTFILEELKDLQKNRNAFKHKDNVKLKVVYDLLSTSDEINEEILEICIMLLEKEKEKLIKNKKKQGGFTF